MNLADTLLAGFSLLWHGDPYLWSIVWLSLKVSATATLFGALLGVPIGAGVAVSEHAMRRGATIILNTLVGLPAVLVGLLVYLLLSRAGPLGRFGLLFTPAAMIVAQTVLVTPLIAAFARETVAEAWLEAREQLASLRASRAAAIATLIWDTRFALTTAVLAGFGRAIAEVGTVMIVGGNIDGVTRVMTTTIALETSKGNVPLALGLGSILMLLVLLVNLSAQSVTGWARRRYG